MNKKNQQIFAVGVVLIGIYFIMKAMKKPEPIVVVQPPRRTGEITPPTYVLEIRRMYSVVTAGDPLNIRKDATTSSAVVGKMPNEDIFEGAKVKNMPWIAVMDKKDKKKVIGYVSEKYTRIGI